MWKKLYLQINSYNNIRSEQAVSTRNGQINNHDQAERDDEKRKSYRERMKLIERAAEKAADDLAKYLIIAVTEGYSYDVLKVRLGIPCCKDTYYTMYRKFFWILDKMRDD